MIVLTCTNIDGTYNKDYTYEFETSYSKILTIGDKSHNVILHDTDSIRQSDGFIITFSLYDQTSFTIVEETIQRIMTSRHLTKETTNPILLIGHDFVYHDDEYKEREITGSEIQMLAYKYNVGSIEVNSCTGENSSICLELLVKRVEEGRNKTTRARKSSNARKQSIIGSIFSSVSRIESDDDDK
jgi:hypothetical protein